MTPTSHDSADGKPTIVLRRVGQGAVTEARCRPTPPGLGESAGEAGGDRQTPTVLCVEDSPIHLKLIGRQLEHALGCRVLPTEDVEAAVGILLKERPDLIVTDLMLPDLDGMDLIAILQSTKDWRDIPVVVHSVVGDLRRVRTLIDSGVRDYILKPFNAEIAIPKFKRILATLPLHDTPAPEELPFTEPSLIPILLVSPAAELAERLRGLLDALYDVIAVGSGPEAVAAAVQVRPWAALLALEGGPWDVAKTMKSLLGLKGFEPIRCIPLPRPDGDGAAWRETVERELGPPPFAVAHDDTQTTITIHDTFTAVCIGAIKRIVAEATGVGTKRIVVDVPFQALAPQTVSALQRLRRLLASSD